MICLVCSSSSSMALSSKGDVGWSLVSTFEGDVDWSWDWLFEKERSLEMDWSFNKVFSNYGLYCQDFHYEEYLFRACLGPQNGIA